MLGSTNDLEQMSTDVYLSYDIDQKEIMYSMNPDKQIAPASITKLMTAIILLENYKINEKIDIKITDNEIKGKIAYLANGESLTVSTLLDFLLVYSANDAAHAVALAVSTTETEFVQLMNLKANELGMKDTNFVNVHGMDDLDHFTTINDLLILSLEAISYDEIIVSTGKQYFLANINNTGLIKYESTNTLISKNFTGLKTGWTTNAGLTFVGLYQDLNRNIITIVNQSVVDLEMSNHFLDTVLLKDSSINDFDEINILKKGSTIANIYNGSNTISVKIDSSINIFGRVDNEHEFNLLTVDYNIITLNYANNNILKVHIPPVPKISLFNKLIFWLFS